MHSRVWVSRMCRQDKSLVKQEKYKNSVLQNTFEGFWNDVIFSGASKFNVYGSDGREIVWRKANIELNNNNVCPTVKHGGGGVLVWGCISSQVGVGELVFIEGITDRAYVIQTYYLKIKL